MQLAEYLQRIGYHGDPAPDHATLCALHLAHLRSVPFENLDIPLGRPISLALPDLFAKIVTRRRGGFCYELNGLFGWMLRAIGFEVTNVSASDSRADGSYGPDFDHLALLVRCPADGPAAPLWLADVGWGDSFQEPLLVEPHQEQTEGGRAFWLAPQPDGALLLWMREVDGSNEAHYRLTLQPRAMAEFLPMCLYHQSSPDSMFTRVRLCTMLLPDGRITLRDDRLIQTRTHVRTVRSVSEAEVDALLAEHFGIFLHQ